MRRATKLMQIMRNPEYRRIWTRYGVAAAVEHGAVLSDIELATVVDVGANRGQFAVFAINTFPRATVYSFEPLQAPANRFTRALGSHPRVSLFRNAIGPESVKSNMHVSARDDSSSILPIGPRQSEIFHGTEEVRTEVVDVKRMNELLTKADIRRPALLKMDVQGYEMQALRGSRDLISCFDFICVEASFVELYKGQELADVLITWLRQHGFKLSTVYGVYSEKSGTAVQADMLFSKQSISDQNGLSSI